MGYKHFVISVVDRKVCIIQQASTCVKWEQTLVVLWHLYTEDHRHSDYPVYYIHDKVSNFIRSEECNYFINDIEGKNTKTWLANEEGIFLIQGKD